MELEFSDGDKIIFSWTRRGLLNVALWRRGHLGKDVLLLCGSRLLHDKELTQLRDLLAGEDEPEPNQPLAA